MLEIVGRFVWHIVIGALLFAAVAGVATLVWLATVWLETLGVPYHISLASRVVTELLFASDVLCFVVFIIGETIRLLRLIVLYSFER